MDSLTQIALGSAVSVAVMGRRTALWKAALWGAVAGTLPDLDAFIDHGNAVLNMVRHRAESHSLIYLTLAAPLLAAVATRVHGEAALFKRWWLALWLALFTHPLLDTLTVYGTQLLQPFTNFPYAVGSVFIIDPTYTLALIAGTVAALVLRTRRGLQLNALGLLLSTAYLAWSFGAQQHVERLARASLQAEGIAGVGGIGGIGGIGGSGGSSVEGLLVTPAPFNTVLWRLLATTPTQYFEGYYSLLDKDRKIAWTAHPRGADLLAQHGQNPWVAEVARFSHGFYKLSETGDNEKRLLVTDLRMGLEGAYSFSFDLGSQSERAAGPVAPTINRQRPDLGLALPWLWLRLKGNELPAPVFGAARHDLRFTPTPAVPPPHTAVSPARY